MGKDDWMAAVGMVLWIVLLAVGIRTKVIKEQEHDDKMVYVTEAPTATPTLRPLEPQKRVKMRTAKLVRCKITAYCPCRGCSGGYGRSTAIGKRARSKHTIAVDPKVFPYGTRIRIDNRVYTAEDRGGGVKGKHIDVFFDRHAQVRRFGTKHKKVEVIK